MLILERKNIVEVLNDILGYPNRKIYQDDTFFSFSLDSVMLANFVTIRLRDKNILDLGTGNGVIPLILSLRTTKTIVGVEIQEKLATLASKSINYNHLENQISIMCVDMLKFVSPNTVEKFDIITCNPPYFKLNSKNFFNESKEKMIARHEVSITLEGVIKTASKLLKNNGTFAMVHRTERLLEIFDLFRKYKIEPKRIQFVYEKESKQSTLVLIEGTHNGNSSLKVEAPFIMYHEDGSLTDMYQNFLVEVRK